jgi:hypothetical protein
MSIQERVQQQETEQAVYMQSLTPEWSYADSFFRHVNECVDPECGICRPHEANDSLF